MGVSARLAPMRARHLVLACLPAFGLITGQATGQVIGQAWGQPSGPPQTSTPAADDGAAPAPAEAPPAPATGTPAPPAPDSAPAGDDPTTQARAHYALAEAAMAEGDPALAAAEYERAHALTQDPVLLFKIAGAHDQAGNCAAARTYYERYLGEGSPDESFRARAEERMTACTTAAADPARGATTPAGAGSGDPAAQGNAEGNGAAYDGIEWITAEGAGPLGGPPSFIELEPTWQESAGWVSVGTAAALLTAGTMLALSAESRQEDIDYLVRYRDLESEQPARFEGPVQDRYEELVREGEQLELASRLVLGAAGLAAASAAVFFYLDSSARAEALAGDQRAARRHVAPALVSGSPGFIAGWEF